MTAMILGFIARSAVHAGAAAATHVVDQPIQREAPTEHPYIQYGGMKGAFRSKAKAQGMEESLLHALFGPEREQASEFSGSVVIPQASLLLWPVPSLTSQYRYLTCPGILKQWAETYVMGDLATVVVKIPQPDASTALIVSANNHATDETKKLFLKDNWFESRAEPAITEELQQALIEVSGLDKEDLVNKLTIVSDDQFAVILKLSVPVMQRNALDENKTPLAGALWSEEYMPMGTVLYSLVKTTDSYNKQCRLDEDSIMAEFRKQLVEARPYIQVGANETVGMGLLKMNIVTHASQQVRSEKSTTVALEGA